MYTNFTNIYRYNHNVTSWISRITAKYIIQFFFFVTKIIVIYISLIRVFDVIWVK